MIFHGFSSIFRCDSGGKSILRALMLENYPHQSPPNFRSVSGMFRKTSKKFFRSWFAVLRSVDDLGKKSYQNVSKTMIFELTFYNLKIYRFPLLR